MEISQEEHDFSTSRLWPSWRGASGWNGDVMWDLYHNMAISEFSNCLDFSKAVRDHWPLLAPHWSLMGIDFSKGMSWIPICDSFLHTLILSVSWPFPMSTWSLTHHLSRWIGRRAWISIQECYVVNIQSRYRNDRPKKRNSEYTVRVERGKRWWRLHFNAVNSSWPMAF